MPDLLADVGRGMLIVATVLAVGAVLLPVPRWLRVRRRSRLLQVRLAETEARIDASVSMLRTQREEMRGLLQPWRTTLKWATHPLTIALARSYWRRWRSA
jgi:hypothetical protein